jgi:glycine betaine/choline ABC-type transport system substrate-binding protein/lipoprotein-anchoring transpeptidase ErfK/SrfK
MRLWISAAVTAVVLATAPASFGATRVVIADKGFIESNVVTQIYGLALEAKGYDVVYRRAPSSAVADTALRKGSIDLYPEYTSTALMTIMNQPADLNLASLLKKVTARYTASGLIATTPTPFEDSNEVACTKATVKRLSLANLNTLRRHPRSIVYAANQEHLLRPDGLVVLARDYGALFRGLEIKPINHRYDPIRSGTAQCVYAFSTDPEIARLDLTVLKDPKGAFSGTPAHGFVALRKATADANPGLQAEIDRVSRVLTTPRIRALNLAVGIQRHSARKEAAAFLVTRGIITQAQANAAGTRRPELLADVATGGAPPVGKSARSVRVFFIRGEGRVTARKRALQKGLSAEGGVKTTIRRLLAGPTVGERTKLDLRSTIPKGTTLLDLKVRGGIATITLSDRFLSGEDATEIAARIAQVVRTADQFTFVTSVRLVVGSGDGASWTQATGNQPGSVVTPTNPGQTVSNVGITEVQRKLISFKYLPAGAANGKNDYRTQQAVMAFQAWHGLQRDGLVGPATRTAIETAAVPKPTVASGRRIEVYRQKGVVLLIDDGKVVRAIHTSTGKPGFGTPAGRYKIYRKSTRDWSYPFQVWLPFASYFTGGYAFHAYADVPATPASHGCARIPTPEAPVVYSFATLGTVVTVY